MNIKKIISIISVVIISGLMIYGYKLYKDIFGANTKFEQKEVYVKIPTDATYEDIKKIIAPFVDNMNKLEMVANKKSYPQNVKSGRFLLKNGMGSNDIINALRQNLPVNLAFNNQERLEDFAGTHRISARM